MSKNKIICLDDPWLYDIELAEKLNLVIDRTSFRSAAKDIIEHGPHQIYALISYVLTECCGFYVDRLRRVPDTARSDVELYVADLVKSLCRIAGIPMYDRNVLETLCAKKTTDKKEESDKNEQDCNESSADPSSSCDRFDENLWPDDCFMCRNYSVCRGIRDRSRDNCFRL